MTNNIVATDVGQRYAAAHAAQYGKKDLREALTRYQSLLAAHPNTQEAGYARAIAHLPHGDLRT